MKSNLTKFLAKELKVPKDIIITAGKVQVEAELYDSPTVQSIVDKLPITAQAQRWGDEIYFSIPVTAQLENDSRDVLQAGELGYWPTGNAFCIFFGYTPASQGEECRLETDVELKLRLAGIKVNLKKKEP